MNVWICPVCGAVRAFGFMTVFGRYTAADAALNHMEAQHPDLTDEKGQHS